jgi:hypothetical protein
MLTVKEVMEAAAGRIEAAKPASELSNTDLARADFIEANVDTTLYKFFRGEAFEFFVPVEFNGALVGTLEAVTEIKRRYEEATDGWTVCILPQRSGDRVTAFQLIFVPVAKAEISVPKKQKVRVMPSLGSLSLPMQSPTRRRLLVRFPTRARPVQAIEVLQQYRQLAGCAIDIEVVVDEDDETTLAVEMLQRFAALGCVVTTGSHHSKIEACNGGRVSDWDVLMLASDDMVPVADGWAVRVLEEMDRAWPHLDGAIFFDDGYQKSKLCTLPIFGRHLYNQFGYIYAPDYKSLFCDREQTDVLNTLGRLKYVDDKIIEHRHHIWNRAEKDELYQRNDALEDEDKATFERREKSRIPCAQFGFNSPPLWLSILICTLPQRRLMMERLLRDLRTQIERDLGLDVHARSRRSVEILVDDREGISVGQKRQDLLESARGHYVAFVDDDDGVARDYVIRLVSALEDSQLSADCASLVGVITENGGKPATFKHSIKYDGWYTKDGFHYRTPNHLNAVRRDLALQIGFVSKNVGEDHDFSQRLRPLLQREVSTGDKPLYMYWYNAANSVQNKK